MGQITVLHFSLLAGVLVTALLIGHLLRQRRSPAATLGWIVFLVSAPWLAVPVYLTLGTRKLKLQPPAPRSLPSDADTPLARVLASAGVPPPASGNAVAWHRDGAAAWAALQNLIAASTQTLDVALFLLHDDTHGRAFIDALIARARAGVRVRLLLDGIGSLWLARAALRRLRAGGVQTLWFIPVLHRPLRGRTNLRNHRKLAIADGTRAWSGGRNVGDEYFAADSVWIDLSFDLAGPVVADLVQVFEADWAFASKQKAGIVASVPALAGAQTVQLIPAGPTMARDTLHELLLTACYGAQRRIWIATPYFVPDDGLQQALLLAARRGVEVRLLLPRRSNHRLADLARGRYLRDLAAAGAHLRAIPHAMLHAKAVLADDVALAGSANIDLRSLFLNYELGCLFLSPGDSAQLAAWFARIDALAQDYRPATARGGVTLLEGLVLLAAFQI
jgi:Phosphatidylserine/phosphatidylglycerophosphate/cardiolipin synthases and related enzymes